MEIREADLSDKDEIISLFEQSQRATGLPDPSRIASSQLGDYLYTRHAIERYVAVEAGRIVGHGLIEHPNPDNEADWRKALDDTLSELVELGGAFVNPAMGGRGIWSALLSHRLEIIRTSGSFPVAATWSSNEHVKRTFFRHGAVFAARKATPHGGVDLFVFPDTATRTVSVS